MADVISLQELTLIGMQNSLLSAPFLKPLGARFQGVTASFTKRPPNAFFFYNLDTPGCPGLGFRVTPPT
jgi:hypothetical protein